MKVLVAGGTGLAGSAIVRAYERKGIAVSAIGRKNVDLLNREETFKFIKIAKPDVIVDAAARVGGIVANDTYPVEFLADNLRIQNNLLEAAFAADVEKFIFLGSSCIYPRDCDQPIKEEYLLTGPLEPTNSAYAIAKIAGIELVNSFRKEYGRKWISLMPTNLYGPNDNFELQGSHVLPAFIRRFIHAKKSNIQTEVLWGTGKPTREFLHVDDLAEAIVYFQDLYDSPEHLNIGSGREISIKDLAILVASAADFGGNLEWDSSKPDGTPRKVLDSTKANKLGWQPKISLEDGVASTIEWYLKQLDQGSLRL